MEVFIFPSREKSVNQADAFDELENSLRNNLQEAAILNGQTGTNECFLPSLNLTMSCSEISVRNAQGYSYYIFVGQPILCSICKVSNFQDFYSFFSRNINQLKIQ